MRFLLLVCAVVGCASAPARGLVTYNASSAVPYNVSFDGRSLFVGDRRALFLSGSIHPPRVHEDDWAAALAQARALGLNMVDVYVFWNFHEPVEGQLRWDGRRNITRFLALAADAGLFVNLRVGPYVCAEWSYGGIPVWVGNKPNMSMRAIGGPWTAAVEPWLHLLLQRVKPWFASAGGPIVLAQIENELNSALPGPGDPYVDWCGKFVRQWPSLVWTMCNGATATNTINTCNGQDCADFLASNGQNGRVLNSQPALWTELELGFQTWGESADAVTTYFWGRSAADIALSAMRWFGRGGSHVNYYMLLGGINFGWGGDGGAGAGVATSYATDAIICPDVLPHAPKFDHLKALHQALSMASGALLGDARGAALHRPETVACLSANSTWRLNCTDALAFVYEADGEAYAFLESATDDAVTVRCSRWPQSVSVTLNPGTVVLVDALLGSVYFRSDDTPRPRLNRDVTPLSTEALAWRSWREPRLPGTPSSASRLAPSPLEQTLITGGLTEFMWYELAENFTLPRAPPGGTRRLALQFAGAQSNAYSVFVNGVLAGVSENHAHWFDPPSASSPSIITVPLPEAVVAGADAVSLRILSENEAFDNSVSPGSGAKLKGLVGEVRLIATVAPLLAPGLHTISSHGQRWRAADGPGGDQLVTTHGAPNGTEDNFAVFRFTPVDGAAFGDELYYTVTVAGDDLGLQCDDAPAGDKRLSTRYQTTDDFSAFGAEVLGNGTYRLRVKATGHALWTNTSGAVSTRVACAGCDLVDITPVGLRAEAQLASAALNLTAPVGGWRMDPSLLGERLQLGAANASVLPLWSDGATANTPLLWLTSNFSLLEAEHQALVAGITVPGAGAQRLALDLLGLGRGLAYINGHRLGRFFLLRAPPNNAPTQRFLPIPSGWLQAGNNTITVFEAAGAPSPASVRVVRSTLVPSSRGRSGTVGTVASDGCLDNAVFG